MKTLSLFFFLLISEASQANRIRLYKAEEPPKLQEVAPQKPIETKKPKTKKAASKVDQDSNFLSSHKLAEKTPGGEYVYVASKKTTLTHPKLPPGTKLLAEVSEGILAVSGERLPVSARVLSGAAQGGVLLGEARLELSTRRIFIEFKKLTYQNEKYTLKASGYDSNLQLGLEAEDQSSLAALFALEFLGNLASGFAHSSVTTSRNAWGDYQEEPSLENAGKKAAGEAVGRSVERTIQQQIKRGEYGTISSRPTIIQVLVLE